MFHSESLDIMKKEISARLKAQTTRSQPHNTLKGSNSFFNIYSKNFV